MSTKITLTNFANDYTAGLERLCNSSIQNCFEVSLRLWRNPEIYQATISCSFLSPCYPCLDSSDKKMPHLCEKPNGATSIHLYGFGRKFWLRGLDSNQDTGLQRPVSCRWTTPERNFIYYSRKCAFGQVKPHPRCDCAPPFY